MQAAIETKLYTPDEYLALEAKSKQKHGYYEGEIYAMAGASYNHNVIARNICVALTNIFGSSACQALVSDMKVWVEAYDYFTYPDVLVICGEPEFYKDRTDTITNPTVIFEILSASTKKFDTTEKLALYFSLASVQNYILVDQKRRILVNYERKDENKWLVTLHNNEDGVLKLPAVQAELTLAQIYDRVRLKQK